MKNIESNILKTIHMLYMLPKEGTVYTYPRTILNILKGNINSINAQPYSDFELFGSYPKLKQKNLNRYMIKLIPEYLECVQANKKTKYYLTEKSIAIFEKDNDIIDENNLEEKCIEEDNEYVRNPKIITPKMKKIDDLFQHSNRMKTFPDNYLDTFSTQREVDSNHNGNTGTIKLTSINKSIDYESEKGEKMLLQYLDKNKYIKDIKEQSILIEYKTGKRTKKYYPDFVFLTQDNRVIVCEVKAITNMSYHRTIEKYNALKTYCEKNGYGYGMVGYARDYYSFEYLGKRKVSKKLENSVLYRLQKYGKYTNEEYKNYKKKHKVHHLDIHSIVIKHGLKKIKQLTTIELVEQ